MNMFKGLDPMKNVFTIHLIVAQSSESFFNMTNFQTFCSINVRSLFYPISMTREKQKPNTSEALIKTKKSMQARN